MRILCLSPYPERLKFTDDDVCEVTTEPLTVETAAGYDWLVSYGYRHILRKPILDLFPRRAINLHIAFLPYNRGAHPNYWSWAEGTPCGVTLHEMDEGIDTGPIIAQRMLALSRDMTFRETYTILQTEIEEMFTRAWPAIRSGDFSSFPQIGGGTYHRARDLPEWPGGWSAKICDCFPLGRLDAVNVDFSRGDIAGGHDELDRVDS